MPGASPPPSRPGCSAPDRDLWPLGGRQAGMQVQDRLPMPAEIAGRGLGAAADPTVLRSM